MSSTNNSSRQSWRKATQSWSSRTASRRSNAPHQVKDHRQQTSESENHHRSAPSPNEPQLSKWAQLRSRKTVPPTSFRPGSFEHLLQKSKESARDKKMRDAYDFAMIWQELKTTEKVTEFIEQTKFPSVLVNMLLSFGKKERETSPQKEFSLEKDFPVLGDPSLPQETKIKSANWADSLKRSINQDNQVILAEKPVVKERPTLDEWFYGLSSSEQSELNETPLPIMAKRHHVDDPVVLEHEMLYYGGYRYPVPSDEEILRNLESPVNSGNDSSSYESSSVSSHDDFYDDDVECYY